MMQIWPQVDLELVQRRVGTTSNQSRNHNQAQDQYLCRRLGCRLGMWMQRSRDKKKIGALVSLALPVGRPEQQPQAAIGSLRRL